MPRTTKTPAKSAGAKAAKAPAIEKSTVYATPLDALKELRTWHSHDAMVPEFGLELCRGFGVPPCYVEKLVANDPKNPKGLWVQGLGPKAKVEVVSVYILSGHVAYHLKAPLEGREPMGRGFEHQRNMRALNALLDPQSAE